MNSIKLISTRLRRVAATLLAVAIAFWAYRLVAVPLIEPKVKPPTPTLAQPRSPNGRGQAQNLQEDQVRELSRWFKPDDWPLRKKPKVLENSRGKLLLDEYTTLPDGRVRVQPCAMIFLPEKESLSEEERLRQAVILEAPEGAVLQFDQPFELTRGSVGKLVAGKLEGPIVIRSDYQQPGPADDLFIETRDVDLSPATISSAAPIKFRFGDTRGNGRGMRIELLEDASAPNRYGPQISGVKSLTLLRNVQVRMLTASTGSEGGLPGRRTENTLAPEGKTNQQMPLEVSCRGAFHFDAEKQRCKFEDHVDVLRIRRNGPGDQLSCQSLTIQFQQAGEKASGGKDGAAAKSDTGAKPAVGQGKLEAQRLDARGDPVTIRSTVDQFAGRCQALSYEVASRQIWFIGTSANIELEHEDKLIVARELKYEPGEAGKMGRVLAIGPGRLTGSTPDDATKNFEVRWGKELRSRPVETEQVVSIVQEAYAAAPGTGSLAADEIHLWFKENPDAKPGDGPSTDTDNITPRRLLADGNVRFDSSQLTGTTEKLEAWFTQIEPSQPRQARLAKPRGAVELGSQDWMPLAARPPVGQRVAAATGGQAASGTPTSRSAGNDSHGAPALVDVHQRQRRNPRADEPSTSTLIPVQYRETVASPVNTSSAIPPAAAEARDLPANRPIERPSAGRAPTALGLGDPRQKFEVSGRLLQVQIRLNGATSELTEAIVAGMARFAEIETPQAGEKPLLVQGDKLHVVRRTPTATAVAVSGQPARVDGRGLALNGDVINLDQQSNRLWIDGPGGLTLLVDQEKKGQAEGPSQLDVTWRGKMRFDGQKATFVQQVEAIRPNQLLKTASLEVVFDQRIDFAETRQTSRPQVQTIHCREGVDATSQSYDERGLLTTERLRTVDMLVNQITGELASQGPGWITRVTRGPPTDEATIPNLNETAARRKPADRDQDGLNYLHVRFQKGMTGNIHRQQIRFDNQVKAIYGPVPTWESTINPDAAEGLGPNSALLTCDRLEAMQMPGVGGAEPHMELDASDNAFVEGQTYTARAHRITYNQAKDLLVLEGSGRAVAEMSQQERVGGPVKNLSANKIKYWKSSNHVQVDDARFLDLGQLPQGKPGKPGRKQ